MKKKITIRLSEKENLSDEYRVERQDYTGRVLNPFCSIIAAISAENLSLKLNGYYNYFGITGNSKCLKLIFHRVRQIWRYWLNKRRRENKMPWDRFLNLEKYYKLPLPRAKHSVCVANL